MPGVFTDNVVIENCTFISNRIRVPQVRGDGGRYLIRNCTFQTGTGGLNSQALALNGADGSVVTDNKFRNGRVRVRYSKNVRIENNDFHGRTDAVTRE